MKQYDVYGIGNALVDTEYEVNDSFISQTELQKGVMTLINADERQKLIQLLEEVHSHEVIHQSGGGSAANTMVAVTQFGASSFYSCKVANDSTGDFFMQDLEKIGVDTNLEADRENGYSGQCISMVTPDAERTMTTHLGISEELSVSELNEEAIRNSKFLYIEGYLVTSPTAFEAALKAQQIAHDAGVAVSLTLSDPAIVENFKPAFDQFAENGVDLIFCNEDEAMIWTGSGTAEEAFSKLRSVCNQVAMTCGKQGAIVFDGTTQATVAGTPTDAVDTTGAGDIFAGVFLASITTGDSFETAAEMANKAASLLVSNFGARLNSEAANSLKANSS